MVCILSDGHQEINIRTLSVIAAMGCYQAGLERHAVNGKPVTAHIYEYTSQSKHIIYNLKHYSLLRHRSHVQ